MQQGVRVHKAEDVVSIVAPLILIGFPLLLTQWGWGHSSNLNITNYLNSPFVASCFILLGIGLLVFRSLNATLIRRRFTQLVSLAVLLGGSAALLGHFLPTHVVGVAHLFHNSAIRMQTGVGVLLVLCSLTLMALTITRLRSRMSVAKVGAILVMLAAAAVVIGYIFGHPGLLHDQNMTNMSLQTALLFVVFSIDTLRLSRISTKQVARNAGFISIAFVVVVLAGMIVGSIQESRHLQDQMNTTTAINDQTQQLVAEVAQAEAGQRGFIITYDHTYLGPYTNIAQNHSTQTARLKELAVNDMLQLQRIDRLDNLVTQKLNEMQNVIQLREHKGFWAAADAVDTNKGYDIMNDIKNQSHIIEESAQHSLSTERDQQEVNNRYTITTIFIGTIINALLVAMLYIRWLRENRQRNLAEARLRTEKDDALTARAKDDAILSSIADGVLALDPLGQTILFNKAASDITGYSAGEVLDKPYDEVLRFRTQDGKRRRDQFIRHAMDGKHGTPWATQVIHKDGHLVPVIASAAPITDSRDAYQGVIAVFRPPTDPHTS